MKTKLWAILLVFLTTILTSTAQILYKKASATISINPIELITNFYLIGGILLYAVGGIIMIVSLRGGDVSVLYPIIAMSYVWVSFLSVLFLNEQMNFLKWAGVTIIILGISFIGYGSNQTGISKKIPEAVL